MKKFKKTSLALLTTMLLAGGSVTVYAAESFSLTMMPTINTVKDSPAYTKSIETNGAFVKISDATYNSSTINVQVYKKYPDIPVSQSQNISTYDRNRHTLSYNGDYGRQSFSAYLKASHSADNCPAYSYVTINWNPNG
jgi:hypothetical protein